MGHHFLGHSNLPFFQCQLDRSNFEFWPKFRVKIFSKSCSDFQHRWKLSKLISYSSSSSKLRRWTYPLLFKRTLLWSSIKSITFFPWLWKIWPHFFYKIPPSRTLLPTQKELQRLPTNSGCFYLSEYSFRSWLIWKLRRSILETSLTRVQKILNKNSLRFS